MDRLKLFPLVLVLCIGAYLAGRRAGTFGSPPPYQTPATPTPIPAALASTEQCNNTMLDSNDGVWKLCVRFDPRADAIHVTTVPAKGDSLVNQIWIEPPSFKSSGMECSVPSCTWAATAAHPLQPGVYSVHLSPLEVAEVNIQIP